MSESFLTSLVNAAADGIITIDDAGIVGTFNPAAEKLFGYTAAEVIGQNVSMLMPAPYRDEHNAHINRYLATRTPHVIGIGREVIGRRKDGSAIPLALAISEIEPGRGFTGILHDLTTRRKLEARLASIQIEERARVARELHDGLGGHMTGCALLAKALCAKLEEEQSPLAPRARDLLKTIAEGHQVVRSVVRGLMPVDAGPEGLTTALKDLAAQVELSSGIRCRLDVRDPVYLDNRVTAKHLFLIAQEAVTNALRHASPSLIEMCLTQLEDRIEMRVSDDGRGIGREGEIGKGFGLEGMRQRARLAGGDLIVSLKPGGGTMVACWIPWPEQPK